MKQETYCRIVLVVLLGLFAIMFVAWLSQGALAGEQKPRCDVRSVRSALYSARDALSFARSPKAYTDVIKDIERADKEVSAVIRACEESGQWPKL